MRAYVTGATGCVGRNLIDELLRDRWEVIVLHRQSSDLAKLAGCNVTFRMVDLYDLTSVKMALSEPTDALFHIAGNVSHWPIEKERQYKDNVIVTNNLVNAALDKSVGRFIFCSTGATRPYDDVTTEKQSNKIASNYVKTKRLSEIAVQKAISKGLDAVILRPAIIIGRYDYDNYARIFTYLKIKRIKLCLPGSLSYCHAGDVARAHIQAYEKGQNGEVYYLTGENTSWYDVFCRIANLLHVSRPIKPLPLWFYYALSFSMLQVSYITRREPQMTPDLIWLVSSYQEDLIKSEEKKTAAVLGYKSRSLDQALADCYEWLIEENLLGGWK